MKEEELRITVAEDLRHISLGPDDDIQHELRVLFNSRRRKDLADGRTGKETITYCTNFIKQMYPGWQPNVDAVYFELG
jgi:hypothetical protein